MQALETSDSIVREVEHAVVRLAAVREAVGRVIFGQREVVDQVLITMLAGGHGLLVGLPGLAKTRLVEALGVVLGLAMVINMFVAATAGTLIPLGLRAADIDPALASSVFITTLTDVIGFFSFLGLATLFMRYLVPGL